MNAMTCRQCIDLLIDYVAKELADADLATIDEHFRRCPPCLVYLHTYEVTIRVSRQLPREAPLPPELAERLLAALKDVRPDA